MFDKTTKPFKPLEQLMAVFPSQSRKFLPSEWQSLMLAKESPIIDFYPLNFCVDLNGKRYEWQGVALLPFVDEKRLHRTLEHVYSTLTIEEQQRNKRDYDRLYIHKENLCYDYFKELYVEGGNKVTRKNPLDMPTMLSGGVAGQIWPDDDDKVKSVGEPIKAPLPNCEDLLDNQVIGVKYRDLSYDDDYIFKAKLLENVIMPDATMRPRDYDQTTPYRPNLGFAQRPQYQRDFSTGQRFIRHSMGSQQSYNQQSYNQQSYQQQSYQQRPYQQRSYQQRPYQQDSYQHQQQQQQQNEPGGFFPDRQQGGFHQRQQNNNYRPRHPGNYYPPRHQNQYNSNNRPNY